VSRSLKAHLLLVLITFIWGATFVVVKDSLNESSPLLYNAVRMTLAAIVLAAIFHRQLLTITREVAVAGIVIGTLLWIGYECQTAGLKYTTPSKSAFLTGISVVLVPVLLALIWRRHVNHWTLAGVAAAFVGLYLLTVPSSGGGALFANVNRGDLLTLGCAVSFAFQIIYLGRAAQRFPFAQIVVLEIASCAVWMWISIPIFERGAFMRMSSSMMFSIGVTALLGTVAAFIVQGWAQQFTPPTHTALIFALEPVFAGLTSYVVVHERLGTRGGIGAALILAGVLISELLGAVQHPESELAEEAR
jgi:drug/metabolite transporter (DMT)-like permease